MIKSSLRKQYKEKRKLMSPKVLDEASQAIAESVLSNFQLEGKTVSIFLPIERHFEINTYGLMERAHSFGAQIGLPVADFHLNTLIHRVYNEETVLNLNEFDIPEPINGKKIPSESFDYVFVPLLAVDKNGFRVGYGKGFYDRFLKTCKPSCKFIGLHLFDLVDEIDDKEKTDIPLHILVTPKEIVYFHHL